MAAEELPHAGTASPSPPFSFTVWPPTRRTRDAVVRRLVAVLSGEGGDTTALRKRYGAVPAADAEPAARAVEAEAFDAASASAPSVSPSSVEDGIETLQLYSREVSNRLLAFVRSRSAGGAPPAAAAAGEVA